MNNNYQENYQRWLNSNNLEVSLKEQLNNMNENDIEEAFHDYVEFGTAGMRGMLGVGTNRMNVYTIRRANVGFAKYIANCGEDAKNRGIVIAHDSRYMSVEFALESAKVMASYGIKVYLYKELRSTPQLSYAIRHLNAFAGIVITASHNPKEYNGYKIYDETGCQFVPELAKNVVQLVNEIEDELSIEVEDLTVYEDKDLINYLDESIDDSYNKEVVNTSFNNVNKDDVRLVYTALHGTGYQPIKKAFDTLGYKNIFYVEDQCKPDPTFGNVPYPNPEDPKVFDEAIKIGKANNADVLLATDPDADRLGIAVLNKEGEYELLNGNITGALMTYYILDSLKKQNKLVDNGVIFTTVVSSDLACVIAKDFGVDSELKLTGFKFIGDAIAQYEKTKEKQFLFGFEESYGSLVNSDIARDKDAVQAVVILCEMAAYYKEQNRSLLDVLEEVYEKYGYYQEDLINISLAGITGAAKIKKLIDDVESNPFTEMNNEKVIRFENYLKSIAYQDKQEERLILPKSEVLKFILESNSWFCLRPSGTEPKAKVYLSVVGQSREETKEKLNALKNAINMELDRLLK